MQQGPSSEANGSSDAQQNSYILGKPKAHYGGHINVTRPSPVSQFSSSDPPHPIFKNPFKYYPPSVPRSLLCHNFPVQALRILFLKIHFNIIPLCA